MKPISLDRKKTICRSGRKSAPGGEFSLRKKPERDGRKIGKEVNGMTREDALELLKQYNKEPFHLEHGETVGRVMRWYAEKLGYGGEADFWENVGILHDLDFELYPEEHCHKSQALMRQHGLDERLIRATASHGYGACGTDLPEPEHEMEKVLFAADELTGLIGAAALMRPSKSCADMELKSLKKKYKDRKFAAGCSREIIAEGAKRLGWELDELLQNTLDAMKSFAPPAEA